MDGILTVMPDRSKKVNTTRSYGRVLESDDRQVAGCITPYELLSLSETHLFSDHCKRMHFIRLLGGLNGLDEIMHEHINSVPK